MIRIYSKRLIDFKLKQTLNELLERFNKVQFVCSHEKSFQTVESIKL